jgi:hypothetical protein
VRSPLGPKPVGDRLEVGLEDRFQHQLQRGLNDPIGDRRNSQPTQLPAATRLGDPAFPHRERAEPPVPKLGAQLAQEPGRTDARLHLGDGQPVHPGGVRTGVARDPVKRHEQRRRVAHEVEQVIEPAVGIGRRPTVKLGLHPRYPRPRSLRNHTRLRGAGIHRRVFRHYSIRPFSIPLPPFPMCTGFPRLGVLRRLRPALDRSTVGAPSRPPGAGCPGSGGTRTVPMFTAIRSTKEEPDSVPAASPRLPRSTSPWSPGQPPKAAPGVPRPACSAGTHRSRPLSTRFEPVHA